MIARLLLAMALTFFAGVFWVTVEFLARSPGAVLAGVLLTFCMLCLMGGRQ